MGHFFGFFSFFGRTKQVAVKMKTDSELALKNEYDSEKKTGEGLRLQAEKIILKWDVT